MFFLSNHRTGLVFKTMPEAEEDGASQTLLTRV
jgi:hypothetical protein